jgi:hypothetical protein
MYTVHIPDDKNSPYAVTNLQNHKPQITARDNNFTADEEYYRDDRLVSPKLADAIKAIKAHHVEQENSFIKLTDKTGSPEDVSRVLKFPRLQHRMIAVHAHNISDTDINNLVFDEDPLVQLTALKSDRITPETLKRAVNYSSGQISMLASLHKNATPEIKQLSQARDQHLKNVHSQKGNVDDLDFVTSRFRDDANMTHVVMHSQLLPRHVDAVIKSDAQPIVKLHLLNNHPSVTTSNITTPLHKSQPMEVRIAALNHPLTTHKHYEIGMKDLDPRVADVAASMKSKVLAESKNDNLRYGKYTTTGSVLQPIQSPGQQEKNDRLSAIWRDTAYKPWHEYAKGLNLGGQENDTPENDLSRKRVSDYIKKHGALFGVNYKDK